MKIIVFNGSVHGARGNTQVVVDAFARGAESAGAVVETVYLAKKEIKPCLACNVCWTKTPGVCVQKDDMGPMLEQFLASDLAIVATPVYVDTMTSHTKVFLDRIIPATDPHWTLEADGEVRHVKRYEKYPLMGLISSCGFPGQVQFDGLKAYMRRLAFHSHSEVVVEICRDMGILLKMGEGTPLGPVVGAYLKLVEQAGASVAEGKGVPAELAEKMAAPLLPTEMYVAEANRFWDKKIAKAQGAG